MVNFQTQCTAPCRNIVEFTENNSIYSLDISINFFGVQFEYLLITLVKDRAEIINIILMKFHNYLQFSNMNSNIIEIELW